MKTFKIIALILAVIMILPISALAAGGNFVSSPSKEQAPEVDNFTSDKEDFEGNIVITSFAEREELAETQKEALTQAYNKIVEAKDVTEVAPKLAEKVTALGVKKEDVAVSNIFDINVEDNEGNTIEDHGKLSITLSTEALEKFVALLHFKNNEWTVVEGAEVKDGKITFSVDDLSPFAIVVEAASESTGTADVTTGTESGDEKKDNSLVLIICIAAAVVVVLVIVFAAGKKKKN